MTTIVIKIKDGVCVSGCALCHRPIDERRSVRLVLSDNLAPICLTCGRKHAPQLASLLDLTESADRVGNICRTLSTPPLAALLTLAAAAESYVVSHSERGAG